MTQAELITEREQEIRTLCERAKLNVKSVELTATRVIVTVGFDKRNPASVVTALYRAMHELEIPIYGLSYHNDLLMPVTEWHFGRLA